jgi:hypothetical protein
VIFEFYNQWPGVFSPRKHNWVDFTWVRFATEVDRTFCLLKLDAGILGFNFYFAWKYAEPDNKDYISIMESVKNFQKDN